MIANKGLWVLIGLVSLGFLACSGKQESSPVVFANGEELHGSWENEGSGVAVFKGVPFAAPPVDELRWRAPVPNKPRGGPQMAVEFAPACMQTSYITDWYADVAKTFGHGPETVGRPKSVNEDCLYLNIWSPRPEPGADLPVMVWVHGGSNKGGWSYEPNYIGNKLAEKGVVIVTIAYRLGAFGFFSHPALDNGEDEPVANFGWLDVDHAFRWVADNIESFGGDPKNVTAIGESSGAGNVSDLITRDVVMDQLYSRNIIQSSGGSLESRRTLADEQETGRLLIESLGLEGQMDSQRLRKIPAQDLLTAAQKELTDHYFDAVIDGLTLRLQPLETLDIMDTFKMDVLIGTNADESYMYIDENADRADLERMVEARAPEHAAELLALVGQETDMRRAIDRIRTAGDTLCPSRYLAAKVTELGGRGWVYHFTRQRPGPAGEKLGAYHGTEIPYVFNTHDDWLPTEETDLELTDAVMDYWVQFARSGDPNLPGRPEWPIYNEHQSLVMELGDNIGAIDAHDKGLCKLLGPERREAVKQGL